MKRLPQLCVGALVACVMLAGFLVHPVSLVNGTDPSLTHSASVRRALVSLAFLGALLARRDGRGVQ